MIYDLVFLYGLWEVAGHKLKMMGIPVNNYNRDLSISGYELFTYGRVSSGEIKNEKSGPICTPQRFMDTILLQNRK